MKIGKYLFPDKETQQEKIDSLLEQGYEFYGNKQETTKEATFDDEGNELTPTEYSDRWQLDVILHDKETHLYGWKKYAVEVSCDGNSPLIGVCYQTYKI